MQHSTPGARALRAAALIWLAVFLTSALCWAQVQPQKPVPQPPGGGGTGAIRLVGDPDIGPQLVQPIPGGQPATFERFVGVERGGVLEATCVTVRLSPDPAGLNARLTGTITPKRKARACAEGEIRTCGPGDTGDCGKYTVTLTSQFDTPPNTYRFDLIGRCAICVPVQERVGGVRLAIAKPRVEVSATPGSLVVPAGTTATYNVVVKRSGYLGPITLNLTVPAALQNAELTPRTIPASANPDDQHTAVLLVRTQPTTPAGPFSFTVSPSLVAPDADKVSATVNLAVLPVPQAERLAITIEPGSLDARRSTCARFGLKVTPINFPANFQGTVNLRLSGSNPALPNTMSVGFTPASVAITEASSEVPSELQVEVPPAAAEQTYQLTVEGSVTVNGRTVTDQETASLKVKAAPPRLTLSTNLAANPQVEPGMMTDFLLNLDRGTVFGCSPGYTGEVELTTVDPQDLNHMFTLQPGLGNLARIEITADSDARDGDFNYMIGADSDDYEIEPLTVTIEVRRPPIAVTAPAGGSTLTSGQAAMAAWSIAGSTAAISSQDVQISFDGGTWQDLFNGKNLPAGQRSLNFVVPTPSGSMASAKLRVIAKNSAGQVVVMGDSGAFTVVRPPAPPPPPPLAGNLTTSPVSLSFSAVPGGANPAPRAVTIGSTGSVLGWSATENASWLTLNPASGTTPGALTASVNIAGLVPGTYNAAITLAASGSPNVTVPVSLTLTSPPPPAGSLTVSPPSLSFTAPQGGPAPAVQVLQIGSSAAPLSWSVSDNSAFVNLSQAAGTTPGATNVSINVAGLAAGSYSATITVTAPGAPVVTVPVSLIVTAVGAGTPVVNGFSPFSGPFGTQVEILGLNFTGVTAVTFNNVPSASFPRLPNGNLLATVPNGATTGPIRVTNASGTGASFTPFTVTPAGGGPSIALFNPPSGRPGDRITIQGANFQDPSQVFFNGVASPFVLFAGPNFLSAEVPAGATSGPIRVTTSAGSATSTQSFVVTQ